MKNYCRYLYGTRLSLATITFSVRHYYNNLTGKGKYSKTLKKLNHIWIFSDSIMGHEVQSQALASRLSDEVSVFHCALRQPWSSFAPRILPRFGKNIIWENNRPNISQAPNAIITCGRQMAAIGKFFKRQCQCQHIQILNPGDNTEKYDVLICPEHDELKGANIISTQGSLHALSVSSLKQKQSECSQLHHLFDEQKTIGLILGNPANNFYKKLPLLAQQIQKFYSNHSLIVCGSRRTHKRHHSKIRKHFNYAKHIWLTEKDGDNPYLCLLACCDALIVSADSINMISEACATDKPVIVIAQDNVSPKHKKFIQSIAPRLSSLEKTSQSNYPLETLELAAQKVADFLTIE